MGWRERFGGDDERARIAARARALLDTAGAGPSAVPAASDLLSGGGRAAPPWSVAPGTGAPADRLPPPLTPVPPDRLPVEPPPPRRGGWVPDLPTSAAVAALASTSAASASTPASASAGSTAAAAFGTAGGRHAVAGDGLSPSAAARAPASRWPVGLFGDGPSSEVGRDVDVLSALRARRGAGGRDLGPDDDGWGGLRARRGAGGRDLGPDDDGWGGLRARRGAAGGPDVGPDDPDDLHDSDRRGGWLRSLRDRVRWDPGRRGLVAVAVVVVIAGSVAGGLVVRGGTTAVTLAAASGAAPGDASAAPVAGDTSGGSGAASPGRATTGPSATGPSPTGSAPAGTVTVDVAGLVVTPGVYTLPAGSRVADALAVAGGAQPGADLTTLNRARVLVDGEQLAVGVPGATPVAPAASPGGAAASGPAGLVDLNTAGPEQLDALPGVGPVLAQAIIAWRTDHGRFASVDDLDQVSGIGPATLADLRDLVTV